MKKTLISLPMMILLILLFKGCTKVVEPIYIYPNIKKVPLPKKIEITGFNSCMAKIKGDWKPIGKCSDFENLTMLKAQNRKLNRVIKAYEFKIDRFNNMYSDKNNTKAK